MIDKNEIIEKVQATFLDDVFIIPQNETIYRADNKGDRYYFKIDEQGNRIIKASTTTIIKKYSPMSPFLLKWWSDKGYDNAKAALKESSMYGTFLHILWAKLLLKYNIDMSEIGIKQELNKYFESENETFNYDFKAWHKRAKKDLIGFVKWVQDYEIKPIAIELSIIGEKTAGTLDLVCQMKIKENIFKAIVDWKSGENDFYDDYIIQLEDYLTLWNNKFPDDPIYRIFNFGCIKQLKKNTVNFYRFEEQTEKKALRARMPHYIAMFQNENPVLFFDKKLEIQDTIINIESNVDDLIKINDPLEFLEVEDGTSIHE